MPSGWDSSFGAQRQFFILNLMYMNAVIIVAGGKGLRMGGDIPKQFLPIHGKPILMHTIERFLEFDPSMQIVLVLPKDQQDYWAELCKQYAFAPVLTIADGGTARFHSVKNSVNSCSYA